MESSSYAPKIAERAWDPSIEQHLSDEWTKEGLYRLDLNKKGRIFSIDTPPPYPSGRPWHIGAAAHYSQIDMIARTARMRGYNTYFPIGIDRNGLPVEIYTEKKYGVSIRSTPRDRFTDLCRTALDELESEMLQIMKLMGLSSDFERYYRTDSDEYRALTQATFIKMWNEGIIYEAKRPNNYCSACGTTIADAEVIYEDLPTQLVHVAFKVEETGQTLTIATTRPELLCSCQAVIVHPDDERYKALHHLHTTTPIFNGRVEIIPNLSAKMEYGSGAVMICSYGDYTDVLLFRELKLKETVAIDENGRMTSVAGSYAGLKVKAARETIIKDLTERGLVEKVETISHRTPMCERSRTQIEIIPMTEYYLKQLNTVPKIQRSAKTMIFHPESHRQILLNWVNSISIDWPISRRRFYGTEVPIWLCDKCGSPYLPPPDRYYKPWKENPPIQACPKCGGNSFTGDKRTLDTWMDSSISPLFISKYQRDDAFFKRIYPTTLRPQAKDIVRTWLYYTLLRCQMLTGKAPFRHAWIMGHGVDEKGERMSKSKGNVIDPLPVLKKHGADAFRFWAASEASLGSDFRCSEERIDAARRFITKLWNLSRFISSFPQPKKAVLAPSDKWLLAELSKLVKKSLEGYRDFNFFIPSNLIREFVWNTFAAHYVEMAKGRAYGTGFTKSQQQAAWYTLHTGLKTILLLLSPITPFSTDFVWRQIYGGRSISFARFPRPAWNTRFSVKTEKILEFNSTVWNTKKSKGQSLKEPIHIEIPEELKDFAQDLKAMHNIQQ
ncbi:MAG: valine--tRNA ligase [Thaumarchaeota archaeon]|nr:valine--tRNA ligase [Nitrososphaerota archaeon]